MELKKKSEKMGRDSLCIKVLIVVLTLVTAGVIFWLSSQDADRSLEDSTPFDRLLASWFVDGFDEMSPEEQMVAAIAFDEPVRHAAHTCEFAVLGLLLAWICRILGLPLVVGGAIGIAYGVFDEVHQIFVAGRGFQVSDMCWDAAGVVLGVLIVLGVGRMRNDQEKY